jgi:hypothetical protein
MSTGLVYYNQESTAYEFVSNLYSSGADDNIAILLLGFFSVIGFVVLLFKPYTSKQILIIYIIFITLGLLCLTLIQVGSVIDTILHGGNILLALGVTLELTTIYPVGRKLFHWS